MKFTKTPLQGAYCVEVVRVVDHRGSFGRAWCRKEFEAEGLNSALVQVNVARSLVRGTLRGMHYQVEPDAETKLVRCTAGAIFDVIIDLRPSSSTHKQWFGIELSAENDRMLYVPEGFAHGYLTLSDNAEVSYQTSAFYAPGSARGVRHDDPAFGIQWPLQVSVLSEIDSRWPDYTG